MLGSLILFWVYSLVKGYWKAWEHGSIMIYRWSVGVVKLTPQVYSRILSRVQDFGILIGVQDFSGLGVFLWGFRILRF